MDARFRFLERQCQELRDEQRQILGWLAKSQDQLASGAQADPGFLTHAPPSALPCAEP